MVTESGSERASIDLDGASVRANARPLALGAAAAVILCAVVPIALTPPVVAFSANVPVALWLVITISGLRLAQLVYTGDQRITEAMVWLFSYVFLGVAPLVQLRSGVDPGTTPAIDHLQDGRAAMVVLVGLLSFLVGSAWASRNVGRAGGAEDRLEAGRLALLACIGLAVAIYVTTSLGVSVFFTSRAEFDAAFARQWPDPTLRAIIRGLSTMPLLVALVALIVGHRGRVRFARVVLPACLFLMLCLQVNPISSPRYVFGTTVLALLTTFGLLATRSRYRTTVLAIIAGLVVIFPFADAFRYSPEGRFKATGVGQALTTGDFDAFAQINNAVLYVAANGDTEGRQALGVVLFWIPRSLWRGKPVDSGILLAEFRDYGFTNLSAPLWAEFYLNGSWVALVIGMLFFGLLVRRWDDRIVAVLRHSNAPGVLGCILPFYLLIVLRGSLLQATVSLAVIAACSMFVHARDRRRRPAIVQLDAKEMLAPLRVNSDRARGSR